MKTINDIILNYQPPPGNSSRNELAGAASYLFQHQLSSHEEIRGKYNDLSKILIRKFLINNSSFQVHFNPSRLISTSALTDKNSISNRECFLCYKNLPSEQKGILDGNYLLLVNPYPIFPEHFTIVHKDHIPQSISESFEDLLQLSMKLSPFLTIFYNGPECGASAPDHLHFQAGTVGFMPLEQEITELEKNNGVIIKDNIVRISAIDDGLRKIILLTGKNPEYINEAFAKIFYLYKNFSERNDEPLLNIIVMFNDEEWRVCILLREKHRPEVFYSEDKDKMLISPAAADLGGIIITPLIEDFNKVKGSLLEGIIREVSLDQIKFEALKQILKSNL